MNTYDLCPSFTTRPFRGPHPEENEQPYSWTLRAVSSTPSIENPGTRFTDTNNDKEEGEEGEEEDEDDRDTLVPDSPFSRPSFLSSIGSSGFLSSPASVFSLASSSSSSSLDRGLEWERDEEICPLGPVPGFYRPLLSRSIATMDLRGLSRDPRSATAMLDAMMPWDLFGRASPSLDGDVSTLNGDVGDGDVGDGDVGDGDVGDGEVEDGGVEGEDVEDGEYDDGGLEDGVRDEGEVEEGGVIPEEIVFELKDEREREERRSHRFGRYFMEGCFWDRQHNETEPWNWCGDGRKGADGQHGEEEEEEEVENMEEIVDVPPRPSNPGPDAQRERDARVGSHVDKGQQAGARKQSLQMLHKIFAGKWRRRLAEVLRQGEDARRRDSVCMAGQTPPAANTTEPIDSLATRQDPAAAPRVWSVGTGPTQPAQNDHVSLGRELGPDEQEMFDQDMGLFDTINEQLAGMTAEEQEAWGLQMKIMPSDWAGTPPNLDWERFDSPQMRQANWIRLRTAVRDAHTDQKSSRKELDERLSRSSSRRTSREAQNLARLSWHQSLIREERSRERRYQASLRTYALSEEPVLGGKPGIEHDDASNCNKRHSRRFSMWQEVASLAGVAGLSSDREDFWVV